MPRVKRGATARKRHKKVLALTKGHRATKHSLYRRAHESMLKSLAYAYAHRRERKGDMRRLWISRVNAASRTNGLTYGQLIDGLRKSGIEINRKVLADMAVREPEAFSSLVTTAKSQVQVRELVW
ncbi:MAG: 50S ribosomal protein L20 [Dehalococcoidales bacterium]|nr:50S ribosomal protein L20 [Dehalococcoidales bacterium]